MTLRPIFKTSLTRAFSKLTSACCLTLATSLCTTTLAAQDAAPAPANHMAVNNTAVNKVAANSVAEAEPAADANPPQSAMDETVADAQRAWLNAADKPSLAFYLPESSGKTHNGVILIPDLDQHPAANGLINTLRHTLSQNHWHTLALNTAGIDTGQSQAIIAAAIVFLNQQGVRNIALLGEGAGAAMAINYAATLPQTQSGSNQSQPLRAVLLINASNELEGAKGTPVDLLASLKLPIFDAFIIGDEQQQLRADRRRHAAKAGNKHYQQTRLPQVNSYEDIKENHITKRIRGWLDKLVVNSEAS